MDRKELNIWNERHFQICLALIGRPNIDTFGYTKPLVLEDIINKADRMVELLKERYGGCLTNDENILG